MSIPTFPSLNAEQAAGLACVVCFTDFTTSPRPHVPVGVSASTRSQVFACADVCAPLVGYVAPQGEQLHIEAGR